MSKRFMMCLAVVSLISMACGDDEETGSGGCAHVQMLCESDPSVEIDCAEYDGAPASVKTCAGNATTCDAVFTCLTGG